MFIIIIIIKLLEEKYVYFRYFYILMPKIYYHGNEFSSQLVLIVISLSYIVHQ